jgi:secreted trypsin-like serine protease
MNREGLFVLSIVTVILASSGDLSMGAAGQSLEKGPRTPLDIVEEKLAKRDHGPSPGRIILGSEAAAGAYPFQVSVLAASAKPGQEANGHFCGGSMIGNRWVLTAGHCVTSDGDIASPKQIDVYAGSINFKNGDRVPVKAVFRHPSYAADFLDNDLALLLLSREPKSQLPYAKISVADAADETKYMRPGTWAKIIGWGTTEKSDFSHRLHEAGVRLIDRAECSKNILQKRVKDLEDSLADIAHNFRIDHSRLKAVRDSIVRNAGPLVTESMFCAGDPNPSTGSEYVRDACQGDSGGPIFVVRDDGRPAQIGIISWGEGCGVPKLYGIYTRLVKFFDWVMTTTRSEP